MAKKKQSVPEYGTVTRKGTLYYRTRITDADGKQVSLYATTCEELYEKQLEARRQVDEIIFHRKHPTVAEYCEKWLLMQSAKVGTTRCIQQYRHHPKPLSGTRCRQCAGRESGFTRQSLQGFEMERKRTGILYPLPQRNGSGIQPNLRLRKPREGVERFCQEDARLAASYPGKNAF